MTTTKDIMVAIEAAETRETVALLLVGLSKQTLVSIANGFDIPSYSKNMQTLRESIIDCTVGSRLRSMAIRKTRMGDR